MAKRKFTNFTPRPKPRKRPRRHSKKLNKSAKRSHKKYNRQGRPQQVLTNLLTNPILIQKEKVMNKKKKVKVPKKLKKLGFRKMYQDKDGFFMFGMTPAKLRRSK